MDVKVLGAMFLNFNMFTYFTCYELGMWSASFYIGNFIGPTAAGFLVDAYGFEWTTVVFFSFNCFILLVDIFELSFHMKKSGNALSCEKVEKEDKLNNNKKNDEKRPLLNSNQ